MSTAPIDFSKYEDQSTAIDFSKYETAPEGNAPKDTSGVLSEKGFGFQASNPSTIPNARIRNYPNPAQNETSAAGAFYHGAKTGLLMGSLPFAADVTIPQAVGGLVGGTVAGVGAQQIAKSAGAGEMGQEVSGDVGSLVGGLVGAGVSESAANVIARIYRALPTGARSELLGVLSPRAAHVVRLAKLSSKVLNAATEKPSLIPPEAPSPEMLQSKALSTSGAAPPPEQAAALETIPVSSKATSQAIQELGLKAPPAAIKLKASEIQARLNEAVGYKPPEPGKPIAQRPTNMPTEASRAESDLAFQQNYPKGEIPGQPLDPLAQRAWDESAGFRKVEAGTKDVGDVAREKNPEPTRAETKGPQVPEGHTPVESSAMKSYKYDPKAQELEIKTDSGHYVYGDVSPEQAKALAEGDYVGRGKNDPPSRGKAWKDLKNSGSVPVAKIINGKRVPIPRVMNEMDKISEEEWQAGHELETEVEGSPRR